MGILVAKTTGLRERHRASVEVERVVEAQLGLREWSVRDREGERHRLKWEREKGESFIEIQIWEAEMKKEVSKQISSLDWRGVKGMSRWSK